ncbi:MAG: VCBS repeat-containing protein [Deltaproteobacteria bacterium]|nr:VCBS repeat-containing protein [Deltaproteobacteria bacterium]
MGRRRGLIIGWLLFGLAGCVAPTISEIAPGSAAVGDAVTLTGTGFGNTQGTSKVFFAGVGAGPASAWSNTGITVAVPAGATTGEVTVKVGSTVSAPHAFIVSGAPLSAVRIATTPTPGDSVLNAYRAAADEGVTSKGVLIADFNGDGHLDYVGSGSDFICLHLGSGDGRFADPDCQVVLPSSGSMTSPSAADFNEDGMIDLAFTDFVSAGQAGLMPGQGGGVFGPPAFFPLGEFPARSIAADLNSDGHVDLAARATSSTTGSIRILFGDGAGSFAPYVSVTVARDPAAVGAADLNGDSRVDLVAISSNPGRGSGDCSRSCSTMGRGDLRPRSRSPPMRHRRGCCSKTWTRTAIWTSRSCTHQPACRTTSWCTAATARAASAATSRSSSRMSCGPWRRAT